MREIKFKGKRKDNREWVYGAYFDLHHNDERTHIHHFIIPDGTDISLGTPIEQIQVEIDGETLGQYTGLKDKNGIEIYEGDIIHLNEEEFDIEHGNGIVIFLDKDLGGRPCGGMWYVEDADEESSTNNALYDLWQCGQLEVIGNIHEERKEQ